MHIGLDLDGTLVDYDGLFSRLAVEAGLVPPGPPARKTDVRREIRQRHGDRAWQGLQALAYGERMTQACVFEGAFEALAQWVQQGHEVSIVSHKSRYTDLLGEKGPDLHFYARRCLRQWGILEFVPEERIYFSPTRQHKCLQIAHRGCHIFVDDLPEVFAHADFPSTVWAVLFAPASTPDDMPGRALGRDGAEGGTRPMVCQNWRHVRQTVARLSAAHA